MTIEQIDVELARLQAEITSVERAPKSFDEVWPEVERQLLEAENVFRRVGPELSGFISQAPEHVHQRRVAMVGMAIVANRKALLDSERARIKAQTEGGISAADKVRRLDQLRCQILQAAARRELLVRDLEGDGFMVRPVHPELIIYKQAAVERLAAER